MKTEWEFKYNAYDFTFTKEHKYNGEITELNCFKPLEGYPQKIYFDFRIIPDNKNIHDLTKESGSIFITIPFTQEKAKPIISHLLFELNERINYQFGKFEIIGSIIIGTHIPETPEEIELIGDNKHFAQLRFKEYIEEPEFESDKFIELMSAPYDIDIINLFNTAKQANHPIDKFLGYFKILENRYTEKTKSINTKNSLINHELQTIFNSINWNIDLVFTDLIDNLVNIRHKCAHLKRNKEFGYLPNDRRIDEEVNYYLPILEILSIELIEFMKNNR